MENELLQYLSSSAVAAIVTAGGFLLERIFDARENRIKRKFEQEDSYKEHKEAAYIMALDRLLLVRKGMDYTREHLINDAYLRKEYEEQEKQYLKEAAKIRLYASDEIFEMYYSLMGFSKYAYTTGERLMENSKWAFEVWVVRLARMMQEDLGYRIFSSKNNEQIMCPKCGVIHDAYADCPNCGTTRKETEKILQEAIREAQNMSRDEQE